MAARFWKSQPVSGAIVSVASPPQVRLTVASTTGMTTGDVRTVFGIVGTTEANGTWTITVIDATHIDLQGTTFANLYTSGGKIDGKWDGSNTNNWVSTSNGTDYGQTVPGSSDTVTFDGSSGGGTVTLNLGGSLTIQSLTMGAFTGTWDNSVNNNDITVTANGNAFNGSGTGVRTNKMGTATYTLTNATAPVFNYTTVTNLTITSSGASIVFTSGAAVKTFNPGAGTTWNSVTFPAGTGSGRSNLGVGTSTITTLTVTAPGVLQIGLSSTFTIGTINLAGTSASQISVSSDTFGSVGTLALSAGQTAQWAAFRDVTVTGNNLIATSSFNLGNNSGVTITPPSQAHFSGGFFG